MQPLLHIAGIPASGGPIRSYAGWLVWVESKTRMAKRQSKSQPGWTDVKAKLANFDRAALLDLIHDLYAAHKDNQTFLHARFGLGEAGTVQENH